MAIDPGDALFRTAVHEAGHAVIGRVLNLPCDYVTVAADHDSAGHGIVRGQWDVMQEWEYQARYRDLRTVWVGRILTFMAGAEAERVIIGECVDDLDGDDRFQIDLMLEELDPRSRNADELERRLRSFASALCRRHEKRIRDLAATLVIKSTLSDADVREIIHLPARLRDPQVMAIFGQL